MQPISPLGGWPGLSLSQTVARSSRVTQVGQLGVSHPLGIVKGRRFL